MLRDDQIKRINCHFKRLLDYSDMTDNQVTALYYMVTKDIYCQNLKF